MIFGIIIGVGIGFFFKPQIEDGLHKIANRFNRKNRKHDEDYY